MSLRTLIARCLGERDALSIARLQCERWEAWLQPISEQTPIGEDPGYDDDFQRMREEVNKLSGADVDLVVQLAQTLLTQHCKDLRVATN
jgi:type VI secretion system protein VasJ